MRKNSVLLAMICAMAVVLMAGRCSEDDDKRRGAGGGTGAQEAAPADSKIEGKGVVDSGVEADPLGGAMGGDPAALAPDAGETIQGADDLGLDDPALEPEPVPEEGADR